MRGAVDVGRLQRSSQHHCVLHSQFALVRSSEFKEVFMFEADWRGEAERTSVCAI